MQQFGETPRSSVCPQAQGGDAGTILGDRDRSRFYIINHNNCVRWCLAIEMYVVLLGLGQKMQAKLLATREHTSRIIKLARGAHIPASAKAKVAKSRTVQKFGSRDVYLSVVLYTNNRHVST